MYAWTIKAACSKSAFSVLTGAQKEAPRMRCPVSRVSCEPEHGTKRKGDDDSKSPPLSKFR